MGWSAEFLMEVILHSHWAKNGLNHTRWNTSISIIFLRLPPLNTCRSCSCKQFKSEDGYFHKNLWYVEDLLMPYPITISKLSGFLEFKSVHATLYPSVKYTGFNSKNTEQSWVSWTQFCRFCWTEEPLPCCWEEGTVSSFTKSSRICSAEVLSWPQNCSQCLIGCNWKHFRLLSSQAVLYLGDYKTSKIIFSKYLAFSYMKDFFLLL